MKTPSILLLAGTLLVATSAAVLVRALMKPAPAPVVVQQPKAPAPKPKQAILVAAHDLQPGEFLDTGAVRWQEVKQDYSPLEYFIHGQDDEKTVLGATIRQPIHQGEPLTSTLVVAPGDPGFIAAVIRPGYRAISVPTSAVASNSGLISTGDRVDVILSLDRDKENSGSTDSAQPRLASQTLLRDVRVLALNNVTHSELQLREDDSGKHTKSRRYSRYDTVTLEVRPQEAEQLAVAKEVGTLQLVVMGTREPVQSLAQEANGTVTTLAQTTHIYDSLGSTSTDASQIQLFRGPQVEVQAQ